MEKAIKKKVDKLFFASCCYSFFINGLLVLMTGAILTYLMTDYNLSYNQVGLLVSVQAMGNLAAILFSGVIVHFLGRKKALIAIGVLFSIGFGGITLTSSPILLGILLFLAGAGWGINANLINVLVSEATEGHTGYTNILHMSFAIGAFISPLLVSTLASFDISWKVAVAFVALTSVSLIFVFIKVHVDEPEKQQKEKVKLSFDFLKDPKYFLYMIIFFCYVGAETGLNSWLISYLVQEGIMELDKATLMLSVLWVTIIFGRMTVAYISKFIRKDILLAGATSFMFISVGLFLINKDPKLTVILMVAIGLGMAGIYPTTVANASYLLTGAGIASGILFAGGGLGASVVPYIVGAVAENKGISQGLKSTLVVIFIMAILAIINVMLIQKKGIKK
ncbi:MAG TPA: MFS transporter [Epulopiscium sp.]|nr:MFS transporter [Candidatus Epulonipiscium sp.]